MIPGQKRRVLGCIDLVQAEAKYHDNCRVLFTANDAGPQQKVGRPHSSEKQRNFDVLCEWLEIEGELHSLVELHEKMKELTNSEDVYSRKWLKEKLQEKYGESLFFATVDGRVDVVCFRDTVKYIINDQWYQNRHENIEEEVKRIVKQAAKIIFS